MLALLRKTSEMITAAPEVPISPGYMIAGQPLLCAGGIVVALAAAEACSTGDFYETGAEIVSRGRDHILGKAAGLGLDRSLVELIVINNDLLSDAERREGILDFIEKMAKELSASGEAR